MELKDTIKLMESDDFIERFKAEYYQTKIRFDKLHTMVVKMKSGTLDFEPKCPISMYQEQLLCMRSYLAMLERRAKIEDIELSNNVLTNANT